MAKAYFGTKLTENISKTPEGYLICRNVPIARIGYQDYLPEEVGVENPEVKNGLVKVYRSPEQVFSAATVASAEGKDVTDLHPSEWLNTNNHASYSKGHCQNVRKGEGEFADFLIADLFIKDAVLINKIENGQREVSCGYNHDYAETANGIEQINIIMNHVAIVPNGRAGKEVAIRDAKPNIKKEIEPMDARQKKTSLFGKMLAAFAKDASPEEVAEAAQAFSGGKEEPAKPAAEPAKDENAHSTEMGQILEMLKGIEGRLAKLETSEAAEPATPEEVIDALEKEIESGCCKEGEKEKGKDGAELITAEALSGVELPTNPIPGADAALSALKTIKPIIAAIADPVAKKQACDALLASVKGLMPTPTQQADYGKLLEAQRAKSADAAKGNPEDLGKAIQEKYHRKPVAVR
jgi:hypothetical protein